MRKPQRRSLYPWSQISSVVWRLPVIRVDLASQLPIYLRRFAIIAAGAALISSTWAQTPQGGAAPLAVARQAGKLALHQPVERELRPGQTDVFTVEVAAGLFLHVVVPMVANIVSRLAVASNTSRSGEPTPDLPAPICHNRRR